MSENVQAFRREMRSLRNWGSARQLWSDEQIAAARIYALRTQVADPLVRADSPRQRLDLRRAAVAAGDVNLHYDAAWVRKAQSRLRRAAVATLRAGRLP